MIDLPSRIYSIDGKRFVSVDLDKMLIPSDERGDIKLELNNKLINFNRQMQNIAAHVVLDALDGKRKTSTVLRWLNELSLFARVSSSTDASRKIEEITLKMYLDYSGGKNASQQKLFRSLLQYWISIGEPGIAVELISYLQTTSPPKPKGMIEVQNRSPHERPFSMDQTRALIADIDSLYIDRTFDPQTNLVWRLLISEALRPSQLNLLQFGDVVIDRNADGILTSARLMVPIVKQAGISARDFLQEHRLSTTVTQAMVDHLEFARDVHGCDPPHDWPLLGVNHIHRRRPNAVRNLSKKVLPVRTLIDSTRSLIASAAKTLAASDLFSRRFKHTKLTHLAAAGAPLDVIAYAGYQTSQVSLRHYVNLTEEAFANYEVQMHETHTEIEKAFRGTLVNRSAATHHDIEHQVFDLEMEDAVGSCSASPCEVLACLGCYVCPRFEAFVDGPHERVEAYLVAERERKRLRGMPISTVNLRNDILSAVRNIISRIQKND